MKNMRRSIFLAGLAIVSLVLVGTVTAAVPEFLESNVPSNRQGVLDCTGFDGYQQPLDSGNFNTARTSDEESGFTTFEDLVDGSGAVTPYVGGTSGLRWWGFNYNFTLAASCTDDDDAGTLYDVTFYDGGAGGPGSVVASFTGVSPSITDTGIAFAGATIMEYSATFAGTDITGATWVSVLRQTGVAGCYFLWVDETLAGSYDDMAAQDDGATVGIVATDHTMCLQAFDPQQPTPTVDPGAGGAPIPTMNLWGIIAMVGMLLAFATLVIIRRK